MPFSCFARQYYREHPLWSADCILSRMQFCLRCRWLAYFIACCGSAHVAAQPLTFHFKAEVIAISDFSQSSFTLPINVATGDYIHVKLTIEGQAIDASTHRLSLALRLGDTTLQTSDYALGVLDNISVHTTVPPYDAAYMGPIEVIPPDILRLANAGIPPFYDAMSLIYSPPGQPVIGPPDAIPNQSHILWQPVLQFAGSESTLSGGSLPTDVAQWNAFSGKLFLGFVERGNIAGSYIISAAAGPIRAIPEPSSAMLAFVATAACAGRRSFKAA